MENIMFDGFNGFKSIDYYRANLQEIPKQKGVYLIIHNKPTISFLGKSTGGFFKNKDPTVSIDILENSYVIGEPIVYIGKAGGSTSKSTLNKRLKQYFDFGLGKPVGHWGGRYIWQIKQSGDLLVAWKETKEEPESVESEMINTFRKAHGKRPFANLTK